MLNKITSLLNEYLENNEFDCSTRPELDFAYYYAESVIAYSLVTTEQTDTLFMNFAFQNGLKVDCGIFILSFFHELGHHETMDFVSDRAEKRCAKIKKTLTNSEEDCIRYFELEDEIIATEWAIDYINNNQSRIAELAQKIQNVFQIEG